MKKTIQKEQNSNPEMEKIKSDLENCAKEVMAVLDKYNMALQPYLDHSEKAIFANVRLAVKPLAHEAGETGSDQSQETQVA